MKKLFSLIFLGFSLSGGVTKEQLAQTLKKLQLRIPVRVLMDEKKTTDRFRWQLGTTHAFVVFAPEKKIKVVFQAPQITMRTFKDGIEINGEKIKSHHLFIMSLDGAIQYQGNTYDGVFAITQVGETAYLVNHVSLEEYVLSVLPHESWPGWPDEVLKAFCVMYRSYGIAKVLEEKELHKKRGRPYPYDIKSTNAHQVYKGHLRRDQYLKIIEDTHGVVLSYGNKPILAMFDICCGSCIPSRAKGMHFSKAPYLERPYPCYYCKDYSGYTWKKEFPFEELERELKKELPNFNRLKDIKVDVTDDAGIVQQLKVKGTRHWHILSAQKFKSFCNLKSLYFVLEKQGRKLIVKGKGYGHLIGLCQRGAYAMVKQGWNYKNILKFYYPGTTFSKLTK